MLIRLKQYAGSYCMVKDKGIKTRVSVKIGITKLVSKRAYWLTCTSGGTDESCNGENFADSLSDEFSDNSI